MGLQTGEVGLQLHVYVGNGKSTVTASRASVGVWPAFAGLFYGL